MTQTAVTITNGTPALDEDPELGYGALLVAEAEDGGYEPVCLVSTMSEARFLAAENLRNRRITVEKGGSSMCPDRFVIWVQGGKGYSVIGEIEAR